MADCLFCRIIAGEVPAPHLFEDDRCVVIRDINPQAPAHLLVLPREHVLSASTLDERHEALAGHLVRVAAKLAEEHGVARSGYRLVFNTNADAGQTVFHLHLHLLGGRPMGGPPG